MYIIFEGLDNAGKSTAIAKIKVKLKDYNVYTYRFPDRTSEIGKQISALLTDKDDNVDTQETLYYLCKQQIIDDTTNILSKHDSTDVVIIDRYICSNYAYSHDAIGSQHMVDVISMYELLSKQSKVLTIYLDIPPFISIRRSNSYTDKEFYDTDDYQTKIYNKYQHVFNVLIPVAHLVNICGLSDIDVINNKIYAIISHVL